MKFVSSGEAATSGYAPDSTSPYSAPLTPQNRKCTTSTININTHNSLMIYDMA